MIESIQIHFLTRSLFKIPKLRFHVIRLDSENTQTLILNLMIVRNNVRLSVHF